ncbi:hypothetical protein EGW08_013973 [Elysia chlorotica]|uniref:Uncharacterized protein n=1 Tax=Elysia chlorotica TaxID=188477 RepID=A0A433T9H9_ELYCH|nr:hypothetical protein EGW08_013973 [Elysia chlorotica]
MGGAELISDGSHDKRQTILRAASHKGDTRTSAGPIILTPTQPVMDESSKNCLPNKSYSDMGTNAEIRTLDLPNHGPFASEADAPSQGHRAQKDAFCRELSEENMKHAMQHMCGFGAMGAMSAMGAMGAHMGGLAPMGGPMGAPIGAMGGPHHQAGSGSIMHAAAHSHAMSDYGRELSSMQTKMLEDMHHSLQQQQQQQHQHHQHQHQHQQHPQQSQPASNANNNSTTVSSNNTHCSSKTKATAGRSTQIFGTIISNMTTAAAAAAVVLVVIININIMPADCTISTTNITSFITTLTTTPRILCISTTVINTQLSHLCDHHITDLKMPETIDLVRRFTKRAHSAFETDN